MLNQKHLVELVVSLSERFNSLLKDVRAAVYVGAFQAMAKHEDSILGMTELFAFQEFVRGLIKDVEITQQVVERIIADGTDYKDEALERLHDRGYRLEEEKKERDLVNVDPVWTVPKVKGQRIDATCLSFLNSERVKETNEEVEKEDETKVVEGTTNEEDEEPLVSIPTNALSEKEVDAAKKTARAFFCDAVGFMRNAVMAGAFDFENEDAFKEEIEWHVSHVEALMSEFDVQKFRQGTRDGIQTKERSVEYLRREGFTKCN